jgi:chromosome segregation ATPase
MSERLDHTLQAYARLERKFLDRGRIARERVRELEAERDALQAEVERLHEERNQFARDAEDWESNAQEAERRVEELEQALREAIEAARLFNRGGMTWQEYDALLARLELPSQQGEDRENAAENRVEELERALRDRDDVLFQVGRIIRRYEMTLHPDHQS